MRIAFLVLGLVGCASSHQVVSLPSGNFLVTGLASPIEGGSSAARNSALELAARHCRAAGKRAHVVEISDADTGASKVGATDVEFNCVPDA